MRVTLEYPDGTVTTPFDVPRFRFPWQQKYVLTKPMYVPAGTIATVHAIFDNSSSNPDNPDPSVVVRGGPRTVDEMLKAYFEVVVPTEIVGIWVKNGIPISSD